MKKKRKKSGPLFIPPRKPFRKPEGWSEAQYSSFLAAHPDLIPSGVASIGNHLLLSGEQRAAREAESIHEQHQRTTAEGINPFTPRPKSRLIADLVRKVF